MINIKAIRAKNWEKEKNETSRGKTNNEK